MKVVRTNDPYAADFKAYIVSTAAQADIVVTMVSTNHSSIADQKFYEVSDRYSADRKIWLDEYSRMWGIDPRNPSKDGVSSGGGGYSSSKDPWYVKLLWWPIVGIIFISVIAALFFGLCTIVMLLHAFGVITYESTSTDIILPVLFCLSTGIAYGGYKLLSKWSK